MRAVVQRVASARVTVAGETVGEIGPGLLVLLGIGREDTADDGAQLARRLVRLRIFDDGAGQMNRSVLDTGGGMLVVSQFTLYGRLDKGTRPSFSDAAPAAVARELYERFVTQATAELGRPVATGRFAAMMHVGLVNDGPVTLILDTRG